MNDRRRHSARNGDHANRMGTRLYLVVPPGADAGRLTAALDAADVAAVLMRLADEDEHALIRQAKALAALVQGKDAALLLDGRADLVAQAGADGAHLTGIETFTAALGTLKPQRIAGCGGLESRHDAMTAAEAGADYVMFGEPDESGQRPAFDAVLERVAWWAEVFEVPCVAFAASLDEAEALARAGAEFVAVGDSVWGDAAALKDAMRRLAVAEPVE